MVIVISYEYSIPYNSREGSPKLLGMLSMGQSIKAILYINVH